ncbi:hypothetical protein AURDEDRAFT_123995 [Auricularia subglabra TFB-10046 SS5]|nr:hypothetical protein AURDEDRAFT_123995 [Auricularia subglabra TFB-10046 SS5]
MPSDSSTGVNQEPTTTSEPVARPGHQLAARKAVTGATAAIASSAALAIGAWFCVRRRRKKIRHSEQAAPFTAQPNPELTAAVEKDVKSRWDDASGAAVEPFMAPADPAVRIPEPKDDKTQWEAGPSTLEGPTPPSPVAGASDIEGTVAMRAELARVRAENERARAENERVRAENEILRQAVEPPPYSDGERSGNGAARAE